MLDLPDATQEAIRSLDEHWNGAGRPAGLRGEEIPVLGRILCLAQTVEVFVRTVGLAGALEMAVKRRGSWFDPALVEALRSVRDDRRLWGPLADPQAVPSLAVWEPADRIRTAGDDELDRIAEAFARVIDAKSPYTARHSSGVAHWAVAARTVVGLPPDELRDLRRAGLLHDIGKLAISSRILDKPGKLDADEFAAMREHPRYTMQILERVACFCGIVEVAASHHERLDGTGYHRGLPGHELSRSARLLAVADVYEALTADRPYRAAMPREKALSILHEQRGTGLCPAAVDALEAAATDTTPWIAGLHAPEGSDPARGLTPLRPRTGERSGLQSQADPRGLTPSGPRASTRGV